MTEPYTKKEITDAYSKLIYAQGLVDFVVRAGFNLREETKQVNLPEPIYNHFSGVSGWIPPKPAKQPHGSLTA